MQHIGVNCSDRDEAVRTVTLFSQIFDLELRTEKKGSPFAGTCVEAMAGNGPGTHGHIAFYTPDMDAAIAIWRKGAWTGKPRLRQAQRRWFHLCDLSAG